MADLPESVVRDAYYDAHLSPPEPPAWESLSEEERSFYWRIADRVWLYYEREIDILRHRELERNLAEPTNRKMSHDRD